MELTIKIGKVKSPKHNGNQFGHNQCCTKEKTGVARAIVVIPAEIVYSPFLNLVNNNKNSGDVNQSATPQD